MPVEVVSELPKRVNIGHLNKRASAQLNEIMTAYQIENPRHMINIVIESLYKSIRAEEVE